MAGCLDTRSGASLAQLAAPALSLDSSASPRGSHAYLVVVELSAHDDHDCPKISDEVSATLDGKAMDAVSRGQWHEALVSLGAGGSWCDRARFAVDDVPPTPTATTSTLVIEDNDTRWTIDVRDLANDLTVDPVVRRGQDYELDVVWPSAVEGSIQTVYGQPVPDDPSMPYSWSWWNEPTDSDNNVTVTGNRIALDVPGRIRGLQLDATRIGSIVCADGPACGFTASADISVAF